MRLIDADALKSKAWNTETKYGYLEVIEVCDIDNAPTIEPKHGRWIDSNNGVYQCSNCGQLQIGETLEIMTGDFRFCPYCGSKNEVTE